MKNIVLILFLLISIRTTFGQCTQISRNNVQSGDSLTPTLYNTDLNTVYSAVNSLDGECLQNDTVLFDSLKTSEFGVILKGITEGCKVSRSDAATISVSRCRMSINGNFVETSSATTVTWGCSGCSAEANSTDYYVYVKPTSTGSTLNLLISTGAPNEDGYDGSNNKVVGKFYNDASGDIDDDRVWQWVKNETQDDPLVERVLAKGFGTKFPVVHACNASNNGTVQNIVDSTFCDSWIATVSRLAAGQLSWTINAGVFDQDPVCMCNPGVDLTGRMCNVRSPVTTTTLVETSTADSGGAGEDIPTELICFGYKQ